MSVYLAPPQIRRLAILRPWLAPDTCDAGRPTRA